MKKILSVLSSLFIIIFLAGCIKNDPVLFDQDRKAEIDQTTWNANAAGLTYPIMTRIPAEGRPVGTAAPNGPDSTLRRNSGTIRVRINLVGRQSAKDETVGYTTFNSPVDSLNFPATLSTQRPTAAGGFLLVTNAVAGTHYTALSGTATIPANSSFGYIDINILNSGPTVRSGRFLGIQLNDNGSIKASVNYSQIGFIIDQR